MNHKQVEIKIIYSEMLGFIAMLVKNQSLKMVKSHSEMVFPGILPSAYIISLKALEILELHSLK